MIKRHAHHGETTMMMNLILVAKNLANDGGCGGTNRGAEAATATDLKANNK